MKTNEMDLAPAGDDSHNGLPASQVVNAAKVDLWDSDWEGGRYYWTVVPVDEIPAQQLSTTLNSGSLPGDTTIDVVDATGINAGDALRIGSPSEHATVAAVAGNTITLTNPLGSPHSAGDPVVRPSGAVTYMEDELTQDACAAGRRLAFAKTSDPVVTTAERHALRLGPLDRREARLGQDARSALLRLPARGVAADRERRAVRGAVEPQALPVDDGGIPAHLEHVADAPARAGHLVLPGARARLLAERLEAADVMVGPGPRRGREAALQSRSLSAF